MGHCTHQLVKGQCTHYVLYLVKGQVIFLGKGSLYIIISTLVGKGSLYT